MLNKKFISMLILLSLSFNNFAFAIEAKYPDYGNLFLGSDKWEKMNRKVFKFNQALNKYAFRPIHVLWSSVMPKYGQERIYGISKNVEYPIRLVSSIIQRDFKTSKNETIRFLTNTTIGLGGMFDPAKHIFNIEEADEDMEQALAKCKCKTGAYFAAPVINFTTVRGLFGRLLDAALNPSSYIGIPVIAVIKAGFTLNSTAIMQPLLVLIESTFPDPYDIMKKAFGIENYIKQANYDREDVKSNLYVHVKEPKMNSISNKQQNSSQMKYQKNVASEIMPDTFYVDIENVLKVKDDVLKADIILSEYNPQSQVVDSMRSALLSVPEASKSVWNELSVWNRSFASRIKTSTVPFADDREEYKFRYILQKDKNSPLVIIYPSIGEGIMSEHSVLLGKIFYDAGYSVLIQGSHFQWEFVKSMPSDYRPGMPAEDAKVLRQVTKTIVSKLEDKYNCKFDDKVFIGTSLGALTSLFVASQEARDNTLGNTRYISICPPIDLIYAMQQVDKTTFDWEKSSDDLKNKVAMAAAKVVKLYQSKDDIQSPVNNLPFSEEEGKLITGFIMHQKLSDLMFALESESQNKTEVYNNINNMGYQDYVEKYFLSKGGSYDDLEYKSSLVSISEYLKNYDNYKIYHSLNDYLTNTEQLKNLKRFTGNKTILVDNGAHLGFLYRKEFLNHLKQTVALN